MDLPTDSRIEPAAKAPVPRFAVQCVDDWNALAAVADEWDALATDAIEGSPSSEAWMLLPALRHFTEGNAVKVLLVRAGEAGETDGGGKLCGVFPFEVLDNFHGLPVPTMRLWNHMYTLFPAPLLRAESAGDCIRALLSWAAAERQRPMFLQFAELRADSEFFHELSGVLRNGGIVHHFAGLTTRAVFRPRHDAERYLQQISTMRLRRYERRLSEIGKITYDEFTKDSDASPWLEAFMVLEMSGWKGRNATAIGSDPNHRAWLLEVGNAAAARGKLMMLAMRLDGRPIAMKLNFLSGNGGYAFKTAFDETYARYSPGTLLELEHIRRLHARPEIGWMDSLAGPEHSLANRVWRDRTSVVNLLVAPGGWFSGFVLSVVPFLWWLKRRLRPEK